MTNTRPVRQPKGQPTGGQFAPKANPETDLTLEPSWPGLTHDAWTYADRSSFEQWLDASGRPQDPPDGTPAVRWLHPDGTVEYEEYYQADKLQDPPDGSPAARWFRSDGLVANEAHYQSGVRVPG